MKNIFNFILYLIFLIFINIFKFLSNNLKLKFSEFLGVFLFYAIPKGRKLTYRNLNLILNEQNNFNLSKREIKTIALKSYKNTAKYFLIPFWLYEYLQNYNAFLGSCQDLYQ